ncbi:vacuolar cation/proton exchanger 3-like [Cornus florida]|uniref:vacuolar cation/proton exchanger 3-like n=1 Tax=Cornus florida TaxID=4283 RepID=UPI0028A03ED1|nr:vacuolar cation/proton exchanger 3-like [Cornus florida]
MFMVPLIVTVAWIIGIKMDLDFNLLEIALAIIITAFTLQDGTSHYMKGLILLLFYIMMQMTYTLELDHQLKESSESDKLWAGYYQVRIDVLQIECICYSFILDRPFLRIHHSAVYCFVYKEFHTFKA